MASSMESVSQRVRATLESLGSEERQQFLEEKKKVLEGKVGDSPLLDQLCCLRVVMTELAEGQEQALTEFETTLERRMKMRGGWRKSIIRKVTGEYESPMPWLHPIRLARAALDPVRDELEAAVAHPDGQHDPEAWYLLATTRMARADIAGATEAAGRALTNARDLDQADQSEALVRYLRDGFGTIEVFAPDDGVVARIDLQLQSLVLDANAQALAASLRDMAHEKDTLPRSFTVPAGTWLIEGESVDVIANTAVRVPVDPRSTAVALLDNAELEIGLALAGWQGDVVGDLFPAPALRSALGWRVGVFEVAATASWAPQTYRRRDGSSETRAGAGSVGVRVGVPIPGLAPWVVRPAVTGRLAWVPGIELGCVHDTDTSFSCTQGGDADLLLYQTGWAWTPGGSLTIARIDRTKPFAMGFGVEGAVEGALGTLAKSGVADREDDGAAITFSMPEHERPWRAIGWSATASLFVAF